VTRQPHGIPHTGPVDPPDNRIDRRQLLLRASALGVSASTLASVLAACGGGTSSPATVSSGTNAAASGPPRRGGAVNFAQNQEALSLNPIGPSDNGSEWQMMQIYDQLMEVLPGSLEPQPGLAESYTNTPDGLSYTFTLRDAKFSTGQPVTIQDVKFSLDRFMNPKININYAFASESWKAITVTGPKTIRVDLKRPDGAFLYNIGYFGASIYPMAYFQRVGAEAFGNKPIGSGPFKVTTYTHGVKLALARNPHYWRTGKPYLDSLTFSYVTNDTTRMLAVESGQSQIGAAVPFSQAAQVAHSQGVSVYNEPFAAIYSAWLNHTYPPLANLNVRQALNYATPKAEILKAVFFNYGRIANDVLPAVKYWDPNVPAYQYDMAKAKALMKQSPYPNGFALALMIPSGDSVSLATAQILKSQWAQLGVKTNIQTVDFGTIFTKWLSGNAQAALFPPDAWTADLPVDDSTSLSVLDYWTGGKGFYTYYKSRQAEKYALAASGTISNAVRKKNFNALQALAMHDAVTVPIVFVPSLTAVRDNVRDFHTLLNGWWRMEDVWLT
jgi:peptide/nickel transport system substrate-binding protein